MARLWRIAHLSFISQRFWRALSILLESSRRLDLSYLHTADFYRSVTRTVYQNKLSNQMRGLFSGELLLLKV